MKIKELCDRYLQALNKADLEGILCLFEKNSNIISPLYGKLSVEKFYRDLFVDTSQSKTTLHNIFESSEKGSSCALLFHYEWKLATGKNVEFDCIDVFELNSDQSKFTQLTIIYDTALVRPEFDKL